METRSELRAYLKSHESATGRELREHLGISRQALHVHLRALIDGGEVAKAGVTRGARYYLTERAPPASVLARRVELGGLDESRVYEEVRTTLNLGSALRPNVEAIVHYAFTEMLNNAIEHSGAGDGRMRIELKTGALTFEIRERGIGVFESIAAKHALRDEHEAMMELVKGKTTTKPEAHSGEGIFFTSKVADRFILRSHRIRLEWARSRDDVFVASRRFLAGTSVEFTVRRDARRSVQDVFEMYAPEEYDYRFEKTRVSVKLLQAEYISRSEAKRLLANLDRFTEVELDFRGVEQIGQGFADEVFRVFAQRHPHMRIVPRNADPAIAAMIRHASRTE